MDGDFKEADVRIAVYEVFRSAMTWESTDLDVFQERLLLTPLRAEIKRRHHNRMSAGQQQTDYKGQLYVRRCYVIKDQLRAAIIKVVSAKSLRFRLQEVRRLGSRLWPWRPLQQSRRHDLLLS